MPEIILAPNIAATETQPVVTALSDGRFVAVWTSRRTDNVGGDEIYAQGVSVDGELSGTPVLINVGSSNTQWEPDISALPNSRYLVVFNDQSGGGAFGSTFVGRIMNPDGTGGAPFKIDQEVVQGVDFTGGFAQQDPSVAVFPDGGFVVAWTDQPLTGTGQDILFRRFDANGTPLGDVHWQTAPTAAARTSQRSPRCRTVASSLPGAAAPSPATTSAGGCSTPTALRPDPTSP